MANETLLAWLGWAAVLNMVLLLVSSLIVVGMRTTIAAIHSRMFGLTEQDLGRAYFQYLAQYKIAILVFNIAPYLALRIIS